MSSESAEEEGVCRDGEPGSEEALRKEHEEAPKQRAERRQQSRAAERERERERESKGCRWLENRKEEEEEEGEMQRVSF